MGAFMGCSSLSAIELPVTTTRIHKLAFYGCSSLVAIKMPSSLSSIGEEAFEGCSSLREVELPAGVELGRDVFPYSMEVRRLEHEMMDLN